MCFDTTGGADVSIIRLGCECRGELQQLHKTCAAKWFQQRGSTTCEVCGAECAGLPPMLREEIAAAASAPHGASARRRAVSPADVPYMRQLLEQQRRRMALQYTAYCVVPAVVSGLALGLFYFNIPSLQKAVAIAIALAFSSGGMLHYNASGRGAGHVVFVLL